MKFKFPICPYCGRASRLVDSRVVYGTSLGSIYLCSGYPDCDAYVGVHEGTTVRPLGTLANSELRRLRSAAHQAFDPIWRSMQQQGMRKKVARHKAYLWLSIHLGIDIERCHIGMFDEEQCRQTIELCQQYNTST